VMSVYLHDREVVRAVVDCIIMVHFFFSFCHFFLVRYFYGSLDLKILCFSIVTVRSWCSCGDVRRNMSASLFSGRSLLRPRYDFQVVGCCELHCMISAAVGVFIDLLLSDFRCGSSSWSFSDFIMISTQ